MILLTAIIPIFIIGTLLLYKLLVNTLPLSMRGKLRKETRNPSTTTVLLVILFSIIICISPFINDWITTTNKNVQSLDTKRLRNEQLRIPLETLVPSQITPWIAHNAKIMMNAKTPFDWKVVSWRSGACKKGNLEQLPKGKFSEAISGACFKLDTIQINNSPHCITASTCNIPKETRLEISLVLKNLFGVFSDAGYVLPQEVTEQSILP